MQVKGWERARGERGEGEKRGCREGSGEDGGGKRSEGGGDIGREGAKCIQYIPDV